MAGLWNGSALRTKGSNFLARLVGGRFCVGRAHCDGWRDKNNELDRIQGWPAGPKAHGAFPAPVIRSFRLELVEADGRMTGEGSSSACLLPAGEAGCSVREGGPAPGWWRARQAR